MKITEILDTAKDEVTGGGILNLYTPSFTIYKFLRIGFDEVTNFFPLAKVLTVPSGEEFFDIPEEEKVDMVLDVAALNPRDREFQFDPEQMFFTTHNFIDLTQSLEDWIMFQRNLRSYRVFLGRTFEWEQSKQNKNRVYVDDVPRGNTGFTVKFTVDYSLPKTQDGLTGAVDVQLPEPQGSYLLRYTAAMLKKTEGAVLRRFRPSGQAAEHDGQSLKQEGDKELEDLRREMKEQGFSLLSI